MTDEIEEQLPAVRIAHPHTGAPIDDAYDDPYSDAALYCTSGKDNVYRFIRDEAGNVARVELVPPEEAENARGPKKGKAKTNRRGNRFL